MTKLVYIFLYLIDSLLKIESARILGFFPAPSISHQLVFRPLMQELARRGHEIVVITPDPAFPKGETPVNLTEIDVHDVSYKTWQKYIKALKVEDSSLSVAKGILGASRNIFEKQLQSNEVKKIIEDKNNTFDLLLLEACIRPTLALSHVFKAPVIHISSFGSWIYNYEVIGAPVHPIIYPSNLNDKLYNLTIIEKIKQIYNYFMIQYIYYSTEEGDNDMLRRNLGPDVPSLSELQNNIDMLFLNINPIWEDNRPVPSNVIYMGGLPQKPEKELPKDLKSFLDTSNNGVIYVSFGTNVKPSTLPPEKIQVMVNVLSQLPYDVLWKWDKDELSGRTENIRIAKWFPQSDLLKHPNVKLFITQGGLQSTDESIAAGVPLIGMPVFADQRYNTEKYIRHKIGLQLLIETLNEEELKDAIKRIVDDDSYRRSVARLRSLMYDQPQRPLDRAVWWTEHVLRHGGAKHLRAPAANMAWAEYLELELVLLLLAMSLVFILMITIFIYGLVRLIYRKVAFSIKVKEN